MAHVLAVLDLNIGHGMVGGLGGGGYAGTARSLTTPP